jgi:hypothetical protein
MRPLFHPEIVAMEVLSTRVKANAHQLAERQRRSTPVVINRGGCLKINTSPTRQQRKPFLCVALESIQGINVARPDDEPEFSLLGEPLIQKPIDLPPTAPTYLIERRPKPTQFKYEFGEGGRSDGQDRGEIECEVGIGEVYRTDGQPTEILDLFEFESLQ